MTQFGLSYHWAVRQDADRVDLLMEGIAETGATWVRTGAIWMLIQNGGANSYHWAGTDYAVNSALSHGLRPILLLHGRPFWGGGATAFGTFATLCAQRYGPGGTALTPENLAAGRGVTEYELWNEENQWAFWGTVPISPSSYVGYLRAGYEGIKSVLPDTQSLVISGGLNPTGDGGFGFFPLAMHPTKYVAAMYKAGAQGYFDALAMHPYTNTDQDPHDYPAVDSTFIIASDDIYDLMVANGDGAKQIWCTEIGYQTPTYFTQDQQAQYFTDFTAIWNSKPYAGPINYYEYADQNRNVKDPEMNYGIVDYDLNPKKVWTFIRSLNPYVANLGTEGTLSGVVGQKAAGGNATGIGTLTAISSQVVSTTSATTGVGTLSATADRFGYVEGRVTAAGSLSVVANPLSIAALMATGVLSAIATTAQIRSALCAGIGVLTSTVGILSPAYTYSYDFSSTGSFNVLNTNVSAGSVPAGATGCFVTLIGPGGIGADGSSSISTTVDCPGGHGGGGGARVGRVFIPAASLGSTYSVTRGTSSGAPSTFTSGSITLSAGSGVDGSSTGAGGTPSVTGLSGVPTANGSTGGAGGSGLSGIGGNGGSNSAGAGAGGAGGAGMSRTGGTNYGGSGGSATGGYFTGLNGSGGRGAGMGAVASTAGKNYGGGGGGGQGNSRSRGNPSGSAGAPGYTLVEWSFEPTTLFTEFGLGYNTTATLTSNNHAASDGEYYSGGIYNLDLASIDHRAKVVVGSGGTSYDRSSMPLIRGNSDGSNWVGATARLSGADGVQLLVCISGVVTEVASASAGAVAGDEIEVEANGKTYTVYINRSSNPVAKITWTDDSDIYTPYIGKRTGFGFQHIRASSVDYDAPGVVGIWQASDVSSHIAYGIPGGSLDCEGSLSASVVEMSSAIPMAGQGVLTATCQAPLSASLSSAGMLSISASPIGSAAAALSAVGALEGMINGQAARTAAMTAVGALAASIIPASAAALASSGALAALSQAFSQPSLAGSGSLAASQQVGTGSALLSSGLLAGAVTPQFVTNFGTSGAFNTGTRSPGTGNITGWSPQAGDIVLFGANLNSGTTAITVPTGWVNPLGGTTLASSGGNDIVAVYHQVTSAEASAGVTSWTLTNLFNSAQTGRRSVIIIRGANPTTPIDTAASSSGISASLGISGLTPTQAGSLVVAFAGTDAVLTSTTISGPTAPWVDLGGTYANGGVTTTAVFVMCSNTTQAGTAFSGTTLGISRSDGWASITIAFAPA